MNCMRIFVWMVLAGLGFRIGAYGTTGWRTASRHRSGCRQRGCSIFGAGKIMSPGEVLVEGERIVATGSLVERPAGAEVIDLGDTHSCRD